MKMVVTIPQKRFRVSVKKLSQLYLKNGMLSPLNWKENQKYVVMLLGIFLILICAFRPLSSSDTYGYYNLYRQVIGHQDAFVEQSFKIISWLGYSLFGVSEGFRFVLFIYATITMSIMIKALDYCEEKIMSFLIWFSFAYVFQMTIQMRSAVANLLFLLSIQDIIKGNLKKYYIKILIAIFFHQQSVILLFIYPFIRVIMKKRRILIVLPLLFIITARFASVFLNRFIGYLMNSRFDYIAAKAEAYLYNYYTDVLINPLNRISIILLLVYYFEIAYVGIKKLKNDEVVYLIVGAVSIFCYFLGYYTIPIIGMRYPECFNLVLVMWLPVIGIRRFSSSSKIYNMFVLIYLYLINIQYQTFEVIISNIVG